MDFQVELKNNVFNPRYGILGENKFFPGLFVVWFSYFPPTEQNLLDDKFHLKNPNLKLHLLSIYSDSRKVIKSIEKAESLLSQHHISTNILGCFTDHPEEA